jgi:murein L,D-transpeptidase YafK
LQGCLDRRITALITLACHYLPFALFSFSSTIRHAYRRLFDTEYASLLKHVALRGIALLVPFIVLAHTAGASIMGPVPLENQDKGLVPDSFLYFSPQNQCHALLVEKASQRAYLYQSTSLAHPFRTYPCSTGENSGPKSERNDKRTPEGIYYVTNSFKEQELASVYGVRAFPIDYPSPLDQELRRMGYGIWIHGTNEPLKPRDTNGCIVFRNRDILELSRYISEWQTPIIITQKITFVEEQRIQREGAEVKKLVMEWLKAWRESQVERYMSFYGKDFVAQGRNWHQWRAYKKRLSKKYDKIDISINDLQIFRENGVVLARFTQTYKADGFFSNGMKRLYLLKKSPEWKITYEFFTKKKELASKLPADVVVERELSSIKQLITRWQDAWQKKDLEGYMAAYAEDFFSRGLDRNGWKRHKAELNTKNRRIRVEVRDLRIKLISSARAIVRFDQEYSSDRLHDLGRKTIQLVKRDGRWRIKKETWVPLKGRATR